MNSIPIYHYPPYGGPFLFPEIAVAVVGVLVAGILLRVIISRRKREKKIPKVMAWVLVVAIIITPLAGLSAAVTGVIATHHDHTQLKDFITSNYPNITITDGNNAILFSRTFGRYRNELGVPALKDGKPVTIVLRKYKDGYTLYQEPVIQPLTPHQK